MCVWMVRAPAAVLAITWCCWGMLARWHQEGIHLRQLLLVRRSGGRLLCSSWSQDHAIPYTEYQTLREPKKCSPIPREPQIHRQASNTINKITNWVFLVYFSVFWLWKCILECVVSFSKSFGVPYGDHMVLELIFHGAPTTVHHTDHTHNRRPILEWYFQGWCTNCQNLMEQQHVHHPQNYKGGIQHGFRGTGARIEGFDLQVSS